MIRFSLIVVLVLCFAALAPAAPVTWNISGTFDDGGSFAGSFIWDTVTNTLSSWSIGVSGGNTGSFPVFTYDNTTSTSSYFDMGTQDYFQLDQNSSVRQFRFTTLASLTDAGGTVGLDLATSGGGSGGVECFNCSPFRLIDSGSVDAAVPEPGTSGLAALALAALALRGWKRVRAS